METYYGESRVNARPMTKGEYYNLKGLKEIPTRSNEDLTEKGYLIIYSKEYIGWMCEDLFTTIYIGLGYLDQKGE